MKISGNKIKRSSTCLKVDLYEICASFIQIIYYCYYFYNDTSFPSARFEASLTLVERSLGSIRQEAFSWRETRKNISCVRKGC